MERLTVLVRQLFPSFTATTPDRVIRMDELKEHAATVDGRPGKFADEPWLLINGKVYAVKEFLDEHPGGEGVLTAYAGSDCTEQFEAVSHSEVADEILEELYVGDYKA